MQTIYALSTPVGGAIAVIRISGPEAYRFGQEIFTGNISVPRHMAHGRIIDPSAQNRVLDEAMAVYFKAPRSYTGEDMVEFYTHGGPAVVESVLALLASRGLVSARAGEFTQRAFLNGKLDLSQAEAVMDIINAASRRSADAAMEQLRGALMQRIHDIENRLLDLLSGIDAALDYPEELEEDVESMLPGALSAAQEELSSLIQNGLRARVLREGTRVVIAGRPNAGKSSLLNALLGTERAIVTDIAGTTRDIIEEQAVFYGVPVRLTDTAGIRESTDTVESIGVALAKRAVSEADVLLVALDGAAELHPEDVKLLSEERSIPCFLVLCKSDLPQRLSQAELSSLFPDIPILSVSALTGEGIDALKHAVADAVLPESESALVTNSRHIEALMRAKEALSDALNAPELDLLATDIRSALTHFGAITGSAVDDEVIERIFSRFCVGK